MANFLICNIPNCLNYLDVQTAYPFQRKQLDFNEYENLFLKETLAKLKRLSSEDSSCELPVLKEQPTKVDDALIQTACELFAQRWKLKDEMSEIAFRGLLLILERSLYDIQNQNSFAIFLQSLGHHTVMFWKKAVQFLFDSDMQYGTNFRDALLFR